MCVIIKFENKLIQGFQIIHRQLENLDLFVDIESNLNQ